MDIASRCFTPETLVVIRSQCATALAGRFRKRHSSAVGQYRAVPTLIWSLRSGHSRAAV